MSTTRDIRQGVDLHVQEALARCGLVLGDSDVRVATDGSIVTLTGHVRTWAEHDTVVGAARMPRGVLDVDDALAITGWGPDDET